MGKKQTPVQTPSSDHHIRNSPSPKKALSSGTTESNDLSSNQVINISDKGFVPNLQAHNDKVDTIGHIDINAIPSITETHNVVVSVERNPGKSPVPVSSEPQKSPEKMVEVVKNSKEIIEETVALPIEKKTSPKKSHEKGDNLEESENPMESSLERNLEKYAIFQNSLFIQIQKGAYSDRALPQIEA